MPAWEFAKALHLQNAHGWARFVSMQDHYNLLAREEEREMIPLALDEGVGTIVRSPLARGVKRAQVALAWLGSKPVVTAPLLGASSVQQIDDAVASLGITLNGEEMRALEAPYTPRHDFQGISEDAELQAIMDRIPQFATAS